MFIKLFKESVLFALQALVVNKLRTFLSLLGITIGIFTIISVFTIIDSLENNLRKGVASLGDNVIYIQKWPWAGGPNFAWWKYLNRPVPQINEMEEIERRSLYTELCAFTANTHKTIIYKNSSIEKVGIVAASKDFDKVKKFDLKEGRYISDLEFSNGKNVSIIGSSIANALFQDENPIDKYISIGGRKVLVIGIIKKEGESIIGENLDAFVLIPINYARNIFDTHKELAHACIRVKAKPGISNDQLIDELNGIMRSIRKLKPLADDDFSLNQTSLISNQFGPLFDFIGVAGWIIGGFSILVGGFGIANIMFVSVKERTAIIGIQKSLGAKNYFILLQFLSESVFLTLIGGTIGLIMVYIGTLFVSNFFDLEVSLSIANVVLGITVSVIIGIVSGFVPSYGASQLDPVEAIRTN